MQSDRTMKDMRWQRFQRRLGTRKLAIAEMYLWLGDTAVERYEGSSCRPIPSMKGAQLLRGGISLGRTAEDRVDFEVVCRRILEMFAEMEECDRREDERRGEKVGG